MTGGLFSQIDLVHVPGLIRLLQENETLSDLQRLSPEQILIRWVNYHLQNAGVDRRLTNFTTDIQDSEIYCYLLKEIAPIERYVTLDALKITSTDDVYLRWSCRECSKKSHFPAQICQKNFVIFASDDNLKRADRMLKEAEKLDCRAFITSQDVVNGVYKLNLAFVANLFNTWPALKPPEEPEQIAELEAISEETREERTYRNWINSMAVDPYVNWLYSDLQDGLIIFQLYEKIKANVVDWKRVSTKFEKFRSMMQRIQNCNYAIDIGRQLRFSLVGIQGKDIYDGNPTLTLALIWQLMRAYTLTVLANCTKGISADGSDGAPVLAADKDIIDWANNKLRNGGKTSQFSNFQDSRLSDGKILLDLIDCIKPGSFDYGLITDGKSADDKLTNAKYAITTARKIGAKVYALPEDIVEVKPKMVMTVFACLMARDFSASVSNPVSSTLRDSQESHDSTWHSTNGSSICKSGQPPAPPQRTAYRIPDQLLRLKQGRSEESVEKSETEKDDSLSLSINEKSTTVSSADDDHHSSSNYLLMLQRT
uniref:Calponin-homology (CH) domain-containing protein n=1 Tax=Romanomermis culicivorax TaxID=13658 RepID=A0A915IIQ6_ROMCU